MKRFWFALLLLWTSLTHAQKAQLGILYGHNDVVAALCFSLDGRYLVSGSSDGVIRIWELEHGRLVKSAPNKKLLVQTVIPSNDMTQVAVYTGGPEGGLWQWNLKANQFERLDDYDPTEFSTGSNLGEPAVEWGDANEVKIIDPSTTQEIYRLNNQSNEVLDDGNYHDPGEPRNYFMVSPTRLIQRQKGNIYVLVDLESQKELLTYNQPGEPLETQTYNEFQLQTLGVCLSADGQLFARGRKDGSIYIHELETGKVVHHLRAQVAAQRNIELPAKGNQIKMISELGRFRVWDFDAHTFTVNQQIGPRLKSSRPPQALGAQQWIISVPEQSAYLFNETDQSSKDLSPLIGTPSFSDGYFDPIQRTWNFREYGMEGDKSIGLNIEDWTLTNTPINYWDQFDPVFFANQRKKLFIEVDTSGDGYAYKYHPVVLDAQTDQELWRGQETEFWNLGKLFVSPDDRYFVAVPDVGDDYDGTNLFIYSLENEGKPLEILPADGSWVYQVRFSPDGKYLLVPYTSGFVRVYETETGKQIQSFKGHDALVYDCQFSPDMTRVISSGQDCKLIIWDFKTGEALATLITINASDWVVLGPNGLFDASPNAMELMYYIVEENNRWEIIELESLKPRYYEPGLLEKQLGLSTERLRNVDDLDKIDLYPQLEASIANDQLSIELKARNGGIGPLYVNINGKEILADENAAGQSSFTIDLRPHQNVLYRHPDSSNVVGIQVYNQGAWLKSPITYLDYDVSVWQRGNDSGTTGWAATLLPKMYVVCIGTSDYTGEKMDLKFADVDALAMAQAVQSVGSQLFTKGDSLEIHCLTTTETQPAERQPGVQYEFSSKENIENVLKGIQKKAKAEDIVLVYLSGHGVTYGSAEKAQFYYLTHGVSSEDLSDQTIRQKYALSGGELTNLLNKVPALKQVLVIDACNSGKLVEDLTTGTRTLNSSQIRALDRMKDRTGIFILSGSAADKVSYEASEYGQGLLTYSLLQGMMGLATRKTAQGDYVDIMKLFQYSRDEVPRLAKSVRGIQTPVLGIPKKASSFDIGIVNDQVSIDISRKKPVFIRSNFLNETTFRDDLKLNQLLEKELRLESEKGRKASLIFIDVQEYSQAYNLGGLYQKQGDQIQIKAKLFQGEQLIQSLNPGPMDDPQDLIDALLEEILDSLE
ncbi:MAG: caspase family protein [Bacteroidota bacterium]